MPQRPKDEMRAAIVSAAAAEFAEHGVPQTPLTRIAERAGTSIGNLYKYFASKDELFRAAVPVAIAEQFGRLLQVRVEALDGARRVGSLPRGHAYHQRSHELLQFTLQHRAPILFLLEHSEGTPFAGFSDRLTRRLSRLAMQYARHAYPRAQLTAARQRALGRIYRAFLGALATVLRQERSAAALAQATAYLTAYHLAGLRAFFVAAERPVKEAG